MHPLLLKDLDTLYAGDPMTVPVAYRSAQGQGFMQYDDATSTAVASGGLSMPTTPASVRVRAGQFPGLAIDAPITVDGIAYLIRDFLWADASYQEVLIYLALQTPKVPA